MILIRVTHPKDTSIYKECEFESVDAAKKFLLESVAFYRVAAQQSVHPTRESRAQKVSSKSKKVAKSARG